MYIAVLCKSAIIQPLKRHRTLFFSGYYPITTHIIYNKSNDLATGNRTLLKKFLLVGTG